jgi:hypothetical protein
VNGLHFSARNVLHSQAHFLGRSVLLVSAKMHPCGARATRRVRAVQATTIQGVFLSLSCALSASIAK